MNIGSVVRAKACTYAYTDGSHREVDVGELGIVYMLHHDNFCGDIPHLYGVAVIWIERGETYCTLLSTIEEL